MKYIKRVMIIAIMLVAVSINYTYAKKGTVTTDGIRVRKEPSTSSEIITVLNASAEVEILGDAGDWYEIKYTWNGEYHGYMSKEFIKTDDDKQTPATEAPAPITQAPETEKPTEAPTEVPSSKPVENETDTTELEIVGEQVTNVVANIYVLPTISSSIKGTVKSNATVTVQEVAGKFVYIKYENNYGWIRISTLKTKSSNSINFAERKGYVNISSAIVRAQATTSSEMVDSLVLNDEVTIIGEEADFYKIKINGKEAYIAKWIISDVKQTTNRGIDEPRKSTPIVQQEDVKEKQTVVETKAPVVEEQKVDVPKSSIGDQMAEMAKSYIGYKYVYGGSTPNTGFDCSGLVYYICTKLGYSVNRTADNQVNNGIQVDKSKLEIGDLVFFTSYGSKTKEIGHVGIYIGNDEFVHASTPSTGVITSSLNSNDYVSRYVTARRIGV